MKEKQWSDYNRNTSDKMSNCISLCFILSVQMMRNNAWGWGLISAGGTCFSRFTYFRGKESWLYRSSKLGTWYTEYHKVFLLFHRSVNANSCGCTTFSILDGRFLTWRYTGETIETGGLSTGQFVPADIQVENTGYVPKSMAGQCLE